jgi:hypothetical protein
MAQIEEAKPSRKSNKINKPGKVALNAALPLGSYYYVFIRNTVLLLVV